MNTPKSYASPSGHKVGQETATSELPVNVVVCGDRNVLWGIAVTIRSALENSSGPLAITIIESGFREADRTALRSSWQHSNNHSVNFHNLDFDKIKDFRSTRYLKSKLTYARYYIDEILPDADKCIYLDSDLIVLRDLHEAAKINLGNAIAGVVQDISTRANDGHLELCHKLGIVETDGYFNGGVLILDLKKYREQGIRKKLVSVSIELFDKLEAQDQAAMNIVLEGKTHILDPVWNTCQYEVHKGVDNVVLHLIGQSKPWQSDYNYEFKDLFFSYLDRTAYKGCRPKPISGLVARISRLTPTRDMVAGKLRRLLSRSA